MSLIGKFDEIRKYLALKAYRSTIPDKVKKMRAKEKIKVVFVLTNVSEWSTERLFTEMKKHPRFDPVIAVTFNLSYFPSENIINYNKLTDYLKGRNYEYVELNHSGIQKLEPDLVFYDKQYDSRLDPAVFFKPIRTNSLFAFIPYGFDILNGNNFNYITDYLKHCWLYFTENEYVADYLRNFYNNYPREFISLGTPIMDDLSNHKVEKNPWPKSSRKKIIYAPHHSFLPTSTLYFGTFLENGEFMLKMAQKYRDQIEIIIKPHPVLVKVLDEYWGFEKTSKYFKQWESLENCSIYDGPYLDLFFTSDAMIHDCCAFQVEYLYTRKPALFMFASSESKERIFSSLNEFGKMALNNHYHSISHEDIENFIQNIINNKDVKFEKRIAFCDTKLIQPDRKSSTSKIINYILGEA